MNRLASLLPLHAAALLFLVAVSPAPAARTEPPSPLAAENCALTLPSDWHSLNIQKPRGMVAAFADPDGNRTLMVFVFQRGRPAPPMNAAYVAEFDRGVETSGGSKKTAGKFTRVAGFEAYERRGTMVIKGRDMQAHSWSIPTGDGLYLIEVFTPRNAPADDPQIAEAVDSFHFLRTPGPTLRPATSGPSRNPPDAAQRAGYQTGWASGGLGALLLALRVAFRLNPSRKSSSTTGPSGSQPILYGGGFAPTGGLPPPLPVAPPAPAPRLPPDLY